MKKILVLKFVLLLFYNFISELNAEENDKFSWSLFAKCYYSSSGVTDSNSYFKSGASANYDLEFLYLSAAVTRFFNYQVTDRLGNYEDRSFYEADFSIDGYIKNFLTLSGEYSKSTDFNNLQKDYYFGSISFMFYDITLSADYSYEKSEFEILSNHIKDSRNSVSFEAGYDFTDSFSIDAGCSRISEKYEFIDYNYDKNTIRVGSVLSPKDNLFIIPGLFVGNDSEDYNFLGFDAGLLVKIAERVKISITYSYSYFFTGQSETTSTTGTGGGGQGNGPESGQKSVLNVSDGGDSYTTQNAGLGVTILFW